MRSLTASGVVGMLSILVSSSAFSGFTRILEASSSTLLTCSQNTPLVAALAQELKCQVQAGPSKGCKTYEYGVDTAPDDASNPAYAPIQALMDAVDSYIPTPTREVDKPFLMPVEDVFGIKGRGTVATGRIERGIVKVGDEVELVGITATRKIVVTGVEMFRKLLEEGLAGDNPLGRDIRVALSKAAEARHRADHPARNDANDMGEDRAALSSHLQALIDDRVWEKKR